MTLQVGQMLSHYRLAEKLGEGGMGVVYKALDTRLKRPVAIKILPQEVTADAQRRRRLLREARTAAAVTHPNVAAIHEADEAGGMVFIVMEYVEGRSLRSLIGGRPLPVAEALRLGAEIAEGLASAHQARVIHRDLKPDNVMVRPDGHVKILDFGLAKLIEERGELTLAEASRAETLVADITREGAIAGTPVYMSPEQARGQPVDARSDLFSFGSLLYEMVTGRRPFQGATLTETLSAILSGAPVPAAELNPQVPPELERILSKCLEKAPQDRYQHADDLLVDLRRLRQGTEAPAHRVAPRTRTRAPRWALYVGGIVVALVALWIIAPSMRQRTQEASGPGSMKSLAVLPLVNLSGDPSQEYYADGVTEELIAELGKIRALRVISRTSVMQYKNGRKPIPEVARELNVGAVVEGSVQRADGRVRIRARLVDAANDRQLWSDSYERDAQDVLRLQDQVAEAIAAAIAVELTPEEQNRLASARRVDPRAHEAYLQGRYYVDRETLADLQQAIAHFEAAIGVDPTYAPAHAGLAESYYNASTMFLPPSEAMPRARAAALRALEIDPTLPQALVALGTVRTFYDWDWRRGPADLERAVALNPGDALAHKIYGYYLAIVRRFDEAIQQLQLARELDPLSLHTRVFALFPLYEGRRYDEAIEGALKVLATHPSAWNARWILGQAYLQKKEYSKAIEAFRRASEDKGAEESAVLALLGSAYAAAGERDEALKILKQLLERPRDIQLHAYQVAVLYVALDDRNRAFEWLEKSLEQRSEDVLFLQNDPLLDALRPDPRFARLLQRIGFPK